MALVLLTEPTPTSPPSSDADWGYAMSKQTAALQAFTGRSIVDGSTIHAGTVILVGNALYKSTTDTTISGTPSLYVKILPAGASATAFFVSNLSDVSWNFVTGQYVDPYGAVCLFDEARAINEGQLSTARTMQGQVAHMAGALDINGALTGVTSLSMGGALDGVTDILMNGVSSGPGAVNTVRFTNALSDYFLPGVSMAIGETRIFRIVTGPARIYTPSGAGRTWDVLGMAKPASGTLSQFMELSKAHSSLIWETSDVAGGQFYAICTRTT